MYIRTMNWLKTTIAVLLLLFITVEIYLAASDKLFVNYVIAGTLLQGKTGPDIDELKDFPARTMDSNMPAPWPRHSDYGKVAPAPELLAKAMEYETTALVLIKNDSLLFEDYRGFGAIHQVSNSFSMAKSITSALIGIALKEGLISSLDDALGKYIPEFNTEKYNKITLKHLLWMGSGLDFHESYGDPFGWPAKAYYGKDVNATVINPDISLEPGIQYVYKGGDTQLLGMVLAKVCGKSVADYAAEKLWKPLNAEDAAYWSLDTENGMEKVSCCFYATARDFARLGSLYLHKGNWRGLQLMDTSFIEASLKAAPLQNLDGNAVTNYGYQWWLTQHNGLDVFYARGIRGQYIFCIPEKNLVLVRLGHRRASKTGDELPEDGKVYLDMALETGRN